MTLYDLSLFLTGNATGIAMGLILAVIMLRG